MKYIVHDHTHARNVHCGSVKCIQHTCRLITISHDVQKPRVRFPMWRIVNITIGTYRRCRTNKLERDDYAYPRIDRFNCIDFGYRFCTEILRFGKTSDLARFLLIFG